VCVCVCTASTNPCGFIRPPMFLPSSPYISKEFDIKTTQKINSTIYDVATVSSTLSESLSSRNNIDTFAFNEFLRYTYSVCVYVCVYISICVCVCMLYTSDCEDKLRILTDFRCNLGISQPADIGNRMNTRVADRDSCTSKKVSFPILGFWFF